MANIYEELQKAIVAKAALNATLAAAPFHFSMAPEGTALPFVAFELSAQIDRNASTVQHYFSVEFNVISGADSSEQANDLMAALIAAFEGATLTVTGFTALPMGQLSSRLFRNPDRLWQAAMTFGVRVY